MNETSKYCHLDKILTAALLKDHTALAIIVWLLSKADEGGIVELTRSQASQELGMNPNTFYSAYVRVVNKYSIGNSSVNSNGNSSSSTFRLIQTVLGGTGKASGNSSINRSINSKRKESAPSLALSPRTPNTLSTPARKENLSTREGKFSALEAITTEDMQHIAEDYKVSLGKVQFSYEQLKNYCGAHGKTYKDYKRALRNFVLGDIKTLITTKSKVYDATNI